MSSIDAPKAPPPPPDPPPEPDHLQDPIAHELTPMEKWEAGEDRQMAQDIVANRQQAEILRQQGNYEGAQQIEDFIAKLPVSDAIKDNPQAYLDGHAISSSYEPVDRPREPGDRVTIADTPDDLPPHIRERLDENAIEGMRWPVEVHDRVMAGGESFEKFSHYDWNDAGSTAERQAVTLAEDPGRPMTWLREPEAGREEVFFDVIQDIRDTPLAKQMTDAEIGQLGRDFVPSDAPEGLAIAREFDGGQDRAAARNARYTLTFEEGTPVVYLKSVVAPQDSPLDDRVGDAELPGGAEQVYLLDHDTDRSTLTVSPVGGRVQFDSDGSMRWGYRDRPLP